MIRQAITCDICGSEKRQTNHWFVAYELNGEMRISGWSSRHRLRPGSKHLCGQTCLHKLVDEFMAKSIAVRAQRNHEEEPASATATDTSLTSKAAYGNPDRSFGQNPSRNLDGSLAMDTSFNLDLDLESSVRLLTPAEPGAVQPASRLSTGLVTMPLRKNADATSSVPCEQHLNSANRRAEAWERERQRELRAAERRPDIIRRRSKQ